MASSPSTTPAYLAEHYLYEVNMLRAAHGLLASAASQAHANALIESFAVHARNLMDFFLSAARGDDAVASHFTASGTFAATATRAIPGDLRTRLNKQIAHLTYSRTGAVKIGIADRQALLQALECDHAAFKQAVAPAFSAAFRNELAFVPTAAMPSPAKVFHIT